MVKYFNIKLSVWHRPPRGKEINSCEGAQLSSSKVKDASAGVGALLTQTVEATLVWCSGGNVPWGDKVQAELP